MMRGSNRSGEGKEEEEDRDMSGGGKEEEGKHDGEEEDLFEIAVLIDELRHEDVQYRLNSMQKLTVIAEALGPQRTRDELLPFLGSSIDDDDEVLVAMAEQLGQLVPYIGGNEYAYKLLGPLEKLAHVEEMAVRDKTIEGLNKIASEMPTKDLVSYFVPLIKRLASKDWFTSRISAAGILAAPYEHVTAEAAQELDEIYQRLVEDDTPMVRRATCANLGAFSKKIPSGKCEQVTLPLLKKLASDEQDSVRLLAVDNCTVLAQLVSKPQIDESLLPTAMMLANDRSWRVRWSVANKYVALCEALGPQAARNELLKPFVSLLDDHEAEVRTAAAAAVTDVSKRIPKEDVINNILPRVKSLSSDPSEHVRKSLAEVIMGLARVLGPDDTMEKLLPFILDLLKDNESQVRLNIISTLEELNAVVGVRVLSESLLPAITYLAEDKQWRVRMAIIEFMPLLANQLGREFFNDQLTQLCIRWLSDDVSSIREAAAVNLRKLTETFGEQWALSQIVPHIEALQKHQSYLVRLSSIYALYEVCIAVSKKTRHERFLPSILSMSEDTIANVRFNVSKVLQRLAPYLPQRVIQQTVKQQLRQLLNDSDHDVQFFSAEALAACQQSE
eukprot:gb/GECG01002104.1/.p1 GENE.gb/GECG01002104.1/~~gb/GECG01002104.1/.p1  ORF type:complete len:615 (+),score=93.63 gb/GECG01002104.1/:1-1845(+)